MSDVLVDAYPLYVRVTFNRTSTTMQPYHANTLYWTEEMLDMFLKNKTDGHKNTKEHFRIVRESQALIEKIIRYENTLNPDFTVNFLGRINSVYQEKVTNILVPIINQELKTELADFMIAKNYLQVISFENANSLESMTNSIFNFLDKDILDRKISKRVFLLLQAYSAFIEYLDYVEFSEFSGSVAHWILENNKEIFKEMLDQLTMENAKNRITRDFFPIKSKAVEFIQLIDNELFKQLSLARV